MADKDKNLHVIIDGEEIILLTDRIYQDHQHWIVSADDERGTDLMPPSIFKLIHSDRL
jgi:hypothetical protein